MKYTLLTLLLFFITSCIPLRIAPTIKQDKIMVGKKFKRQLPKDYAFIFEDPKEADEFYHFINTKFDLDGERVEFNVPLIIDNTEYYLSFYEVEIPDKTLNLLPLFIDASRESNGRAPLLEGSYTSRFGNWYLALTVSNTHMEDCLKPSYSAREPVIKYLRDLQKEYLNTYNYVEAFLKN